MSAPLLGHDPARNLGAIECPTLLINGGADTRLVSPRSRPALLDAFEAKSTTKRGTVTLGGLGRFLEPPSREADAPTFDADVAEVIISCSNRAAVAGTGPLEAHEDDAAPVV